MSAPVAVAVVSWNTRALLAECLTSLQTDANEGRAEVWVVDNASDDGSAEMVREQFGWVHLIESERNLGFGPAVNLVAQRTNGEWLAPANADVAVTPGALAALLEAGACRPRAGALAPRLVMPDGETQHSVHHFPTLAFGALFNLGAHRFVPALGERLCIPDTWRGGQARAVDWALGAFLVVRRAAWDEAGGFEPEQWMYAEDLDLGWRLARASWETRYEPRAVVRHHMRAATRQAWAEHDTQRALLSTYAWLLRRRGIVRTRLYAAMNVAGGTARWALFTPAAWLGSRRFADRRAEWRWWVNRHRRTGFAPRSELLRHR